MEKPEWFKIVDALDSESVPQDDLGVSTLAKRLSAIGAAALILGGGFAFAQANGNASSSDALSSVNATSTSTPAPTSASTTTPAAGSTASSARPAISGGAALGDD